MATASAGTTSSPPPQASSHHAPAPTRSSSRRVQLLQRRNGRHRAPLRRRQRPPRRPGLPRRFRCKPLSRSLYNHPHPRRLIPSYLRVVVMTKAYPTIEKNDLILLQQIANYMLLSFRVVYVISR
ncbi:hypothetical protein HU200_066368 [Digitaria exilis]|uniref:Uncharacterized protein n=1 Tax=Digitaria exilis TaxID=1010633 RepID=A0A835A174_9POAL|nr:hypothetical protein HU200_066368 [Digitaria exilis]